MLSRRRKRIKNSELTSFSPLENSGFELKVMPSISLHCNTKSEADIGDMAADNEPSH